MVTYQIQIPESNREAFLGILKSLQHLGVVSSFQSSDNLAEPGDPLDTEQLLTFLQVSENQVEKGLVVPAAKVAEFVKSWKHRNR